MATIPRWASAPVTVAGLAVAVHLQLLAVPRDGLDAAKREQRCVLDRP